MGQCFVEPYDGSVMGAYYFDRATKRGVGRAPLGNGSHRARDSGGDTVMDQGAEPTVNETILLEGIPREYAKRALVPFALCARVRSCCRGSIQ